MYDSQPAYLLEHGPMQIPLRILSPDDQIGSLMEEPGWRRGERIGKTLVKEPGLSVVLTVAHGDSTCAEHSISGAAMVHCLHGNLRLHCSGRDIDLAEGEFLALEPGIPHSVQSLGDAAFLTTIGEQLR